jgi:hypothetical protein
MSVQARIGRVRINNSSLVVLWSTVKYQGPPLAVEKLCNDGGSVVEVPTIKSFFCDSPLKSATVHCVDASSMVLSLVCHHHGARLHVLSDPLFPSAAPSVNLHRFEHVINGREYRIEVSAVGAGKWRAQVARMPGGSTATMPFYGTTPLEAAAQLSRWLSLAHGNPRPQL